MLLSYNSMYLRLVDWWKYGYEIIHHRMKIQCMTSRVFATVHPLSNIVVFLFSVLNKP